MSEQLKKKAIPDTKELQKFARNKVSQLERYGIDVEAMQASGDKLDDQTVLIGLSWYRTRN